MNHDNPILTSVHRLLEEQTAKGLAKYGKTVTPDDLTLLEWLNHLQQELIDALVYLEVLKHKLGLK